MNNTFASILRENIWQLITYILGTVLCALWSWPWAVLYVILCIISNGLYMVLVCPYCAHYGAKTCQAGFHILSGGRFRPRPGYTFGEQFRRYVIIMVPGWFLPLVFAILILLQDFSWGVVTLLLAFVLIGFVILPKDAQRHCEDCPMTDCPRLAKQQARVLK